MSDERLLQSRTFQVVRRTYSIGERVLSRDVILHPGAVAVVPVLNDGRLCLIRNRRVAVERTLLEIPAGTLEPGEPPRKTAERELLEETGYRAGRIEPLVEFFMSPGILNERMYVFVATDLTAEAPQREAGEEIENVVVPWQELEAMLERGEIEDGKTIAALWTYQRRYLQRPPAD